MSELPQRKDNRLKRFDYSSNMAYFITICCRDRKQILSKIVGGDACDAPRVVLSRYGRIVDHYMRQMDQQYDNIFIDHSVIMPNHIHLILIVSSADSSEYSKNVRVGYFGTSQASSPTVPYARKELSPSVYRQHEIVPKFVSLLKRFINREIGYNIWQRGYYDHIIRNEDDYRNTWLYISNNPACWAEDQYYISYVDTD